MVSTPGKSVRWKRRWRRKKCCTKVCLFEKLLNKTWTMRKIVNFTVLLDGCCLATVLLSPWSPPLSSSLISIVFALFTVRIFIRWLCVFYLYLRILMFHYELNCNSSASFLFLQAFKHTANLAVISRCLAVCVFLCVVQYFFLLLLVIVLLFSGARFLSTYIPHLH